MAGMNNRMMQQFMPGMQMPEENGEQDNSLQLGFMGAPMNDAGAAGVGNPQAGGLPNMMPPNGGGAAGIPNFMTPGAGGAGSMPNFMPTPPSTPSNPQMPPANPAMSFGSSAGVDSGSQQQGASPFDALGESFKNSYQKTPQGGNDDPDVASRRKKLIDALMRQFS